MRDAREIANATARECGHPADFNDPCHGCITEAIRSAQREGWEKGREDAAAEVEESKPYFRNRMLCENVADRIRALSFPEEKPSK